MSWFLLRSVLKPPPIPMCKRFVFPLGVTPQTPRIFSLGHGNSTFQSWHQSFTSQDSEFLPETVLDPAQHHEVWSGEYPANISGEVIHLKTTQHEYHHLKKAFDHDDERKHTSVNVHHNARFSITSIHRKNTAIHQSIVADIMFQLMHQLSSVSKKFRCLPDTSFSERVSVPDLHLVYTDKNLGSTVVPILAVQVGFTEPAESLQESMTRILENPDTPHVKVGITVDIKEVPWYENPLRKAENACVAIEKGSLYQPGSDFEEKPGEEGGSLWRFGMHWVGNLTASARVWKKDPKSGKAVAGEPIRFYGTNAEENPKLELNLSEFVPSDDEMYKRPFVFECTLWREGLIFARQILARERYAAAVKALKNQK